ncbi:TRAP transporter substrate-binding protein [Ohessyouella blattaphilus]|uniref:TRAP transporter substrate-binding protein n=1 Tax=Ohessyouella blattaphilus TaxID=2949333 RepID=A0ABT1EKB8_9FIRM|nr:TRAP transporter substrate-binding protein [Ohessyouella blattaphilus]MCP1111149.1 TRAP transporter substrate-binding protein [Ohessyouella blattaphilus]MCR8564543.1 TRAP transporter substrate-binding protein [Ohessyouella blattaphilus]
MKKMKKLISLMCVMAMVFSLYGCGNKSEETESNDKGASSDKVVVKYSVTYPATGTQADGANALGKYIEECSDGRMSMEFYPSSQLGDKSATFEGLKAGTIEMTECAATDLSGFNDMWSVFSLPYLWENGQQAVNTVMDKSVREVLEADAEANGFIIIGWTDIGSRSVLNKTKTVNTPKDLKGLKLRCMEDTILAESVNAMGAIGTPMAASEVYTGLQQGTIDGLDHTPSVVVSNGWEELCKYFSLTEHFTIPDPVFVSKAWFDTLSAENQEAIIEAGEKFSDDWNNNIWPDATDKGLEAMKAANVEIVEVDKEPFKESVQYVIDDFLDGASDGQKELYELLIEVRENY